MMRLALYSLSVVLLMAGLSGCTRGMARGGCNCGHCGPGGMGQRFSGTCDYVPPLKHGYRNPDENFTPGPPTPTYAYPYYTLRGPRDFLLDNPPSIGR